MNLSMLQSSHSPKLWDILGFLHHNSQSTWRHRIKNDASNILSIVPGTKVQWQLRFFSGLLSQLELWLKIHISFNSFKRPHLLTSTFNLSYFFQSKPFSIFSILDSLKITFIEKQKSPPYTWNMISLEFLSFIPHLLFLHISKRLKII